MEIWRAIKDYENYYEVSNFGNVRSLTRTVACKGNATLVVKGKLKLLCISRSGYRITTLCKHNKMHTLSIHQAVAQAFIPDFIKGTELNHIDGNKLNNNVTNLEVSNPSHNQLHAVRTGLTPKQGVSKYNNVTYVRNPKAVSKWAASIRHNGNSSYGWKTFKLEEDAARHVDFILDSIGDTERLRNFP